MESQTPIPMEDSESNSIENLIFSEAEVKTIISRLIMKCAQEMKNGSLNKPINDYVERVADYTGLPITKINNFISEDLGLIDFENKHFTLSQRIEIFMYMTNEYLNKNYISCSEIHKMRQKLNLGFNLHQIQYMLSSLGFEYKLTKNGQEILIEDPALTYERFIFLKQFHNFQNMGAAIYYIDERFLDHTFTFPKPWLKNINISSTSCDGYVFFHAVSQRGFLHGLFCSPATRTDFTKWIAHFLIPKLNTPSIFILDKNSLHRGSKNIITKYHSKQDMVKFLRENNIPCSENLHKAEIYKLISDYPVKSYYDIEEIFKVHGHKVLWLPDTFHDLSLTHFLWDFIISNEKSELEKAPPAIVKTLLMEKIIKLPEIIWSEFFDELTKLQMQLMVSDSKTAAALGKNYDLW